MKACQQCNLRYPNESMFCFVDGAPLIPLNDPRVGTTIGGRYVIERVIGEGGMATVYQARYKLVERPCAVKIMNAGLSRDPVVRERFRREAKAAQKLAHPNIIEILDQGDTDDGTPYLVMELLEGQALSRTISLGQIPCSRAIPIMVQIARALARAHDFEVIHRDLKPDNIFLCRRSDGTDLVKLLDFGIARSLQDARLTNQGEVFGTPQYMAPERITSIDAGAASDLYSLGVIFFEMLAGELPFQAADITSYFLKHLRDPPPRLHTFVPDIPESLEHLVVSLMAKDPRHRPVDAHRLHKDLIAISAEVGISVPPEVEAEEPSSSSLPSRTLPPVALDRWTKRMSIFEQMLETAYLGAPPADLSTLLGQVRHLVLEISSLRSDSLCEQRKIEVIHARGREGRQRIGFAVDALGIDASKARDEARLAQEAIAPLGERVEDARTRFLEVHKDILIWEGRSGFSQPSDQLQQAYLAAATVVGEWLARAGHLEIGQREAESRDREVADLEFQIHELRTALARLEHDYETELAQSECKIADLDGRAESLQLELLSIATRFCSPLRRRPELGRLFQELEADATGSGPPEPLLVDAT